jgi:flagellum-specific ATP synthase
MSSEFGMIQTEKYIKAIAEADLLVEIGKITRVVGQSIEGFLPGASLGSVCRIYQLGSSQFVKAEVVGFRDRSVVFMPLGESRGIGLGSKVVLERTAATVKVGKALLGRVLNGMGEPIDGLGYVETSEELGIYSNRTNPLDRKPIDTPLDLGVRSINGFITVGMGQRVGIMAGSGVGKSVLLGMMAKYTNADVNVIALIGERGREVKEFIERELGPEGLSKSILVVATSDESALVRTRGAFMAMTIAEYFSSMGLNVLFMMDSVTRFAMAQREIGLAAGEPPTSKGYPPSVFGLLPKLLERGGSFMNKGSITGLFTVLVEGDDMDEPIADSVRSIVDGHIVLSRSLAHRGHFPAVDILQSTSRVMRSVVEAKHLRVSMKLREHLADFREAEDLINIGAYRRGSNDKIDAAIDYHDRLNEFLKQDIEDHTDFGTTVEMMEQILGTPRKSGRK